MAAPDRITITHQRPMTIPTPRAALKQLLARLDETTDKGGPVPAWMDSYCTAVQALKVEREGPSETDLVNLAEEFGGEPVASMRRALELWGTPTTALPLPPDYIDPEHAGQDRELLEAFYRACAAEGGTTDEIHLRGIKAVLTACSAAPPSPEPPAEALAARPLLEQVAAMADCIGAQAVGQITAISNRAAAWLRENPPGQPVAIETGVHLDRFAALLDQQAAELAALRGVAKPEDVAALSDEHREAVHQAVAEALGSAYDCQRVWSAWSCGTTGPDDFTLTAEDDDRVAEIANAAIEAFRTVQVPAPQAGEVQP